MSTRGHASIGLFGGSFNPPHVGHLSIAQQVRNTLKLDEVRLIPAWVSPFKTDDSDMAPPRDRLKMCQLAIKGMAGLAICDYEIRRKTVSYTADTLRSLIKIHEWDLPPVLIIGSDAAAGMPGWRDITDIIDNLAWVVVVERLSTPLKPAFWERLDTQLGGGRGQRLRRQSVVIDTVDISSTTIRHNIRTDRDVTPFVRHEVEKYIRIRKLYRVSMT